MRTIFEWFGPALIPMLYLGLLRPSFFPLPTIFDKTGQPWKTLYPPYPSSSRRSQALYPSKNFNESSRNSNSEEGTGTRSSDS